MSNPVTFATVMNFERETKGAVLYMNADADGAMDNKHPVTNMYFRKAALRKKLGLKPTDEFPESIIIDVATE